MAYQPCLNPNCKSRGKPHPNCKCYMATGGEVHYCHHGMPHEPSCEYYADGGEVQDNMELISNPDLAIDHAVASHGLHHLLTKTGQSKDTDESMGAEDFINHSRRGQKLVGSHLKNIFESDNKDIKNGEIDNLKSHLEHIEQNPKEMLEIGGNLGSVMPNHAPILAAKAASAMNYLNSIKPLGAQRAPLDEITPPGDMKNNSYDRNLEIAQNPLSVISRIKDGTLQPNDLGTLDTIYPKLGQKIRLKAAETLASAKANKEPLSYKHRQSLSLLLGEPLDSTMNVQSMQAIMQANGSKTPPPSQQKNQPKKATGVELKQINQVNKLYETPLQERQIDKKS